MQPVMRLPVCRTASMFVTDELARDICRVDLTTLTLADTLTPASKATRRRLAVSAPRIGSGDVVRTKWAINTMAARFPVLAAHYRHSQDCLDAREWKSGSMDEQR